MKKFNLRYVGVQLPSVLILCILLAACDAAPRNEFSGGGGVNLDEMEGSWLLINYWAEWCAPCREEIPELNELYAERGERGLLVLGVNYDGLQGETLAKIIKKMQVEFPVLVKDPRQIWAAAMPQVLPTTLVINPNGELVDELVGPQTKLSLLAAIQSLED